MEHRVKQRSQAWLKLRRIVPLTASQFADAVGVGRGRPFHFLQSLVERNSSAATDDFDTVDSIDENEENMCHGVKMETILKEAYELLTGFQIQETGFWVPEAGKPMHGLIGASPDGIVVQGSNVSKVLGLVEFKAPIHNLYENASSTQGHGVPRQYMVQMQGQMAVCGAPWCDFMAVCTKKRKIMLKRVFFQPRYWEHITVRLKQFCFALEEVEMMRELGREIFSGTMAQRLKKQDMQEQPFPAEDIITVQNLVTEPTKGMFRGPSHKLLPYDVLVGDAYCLSPALQSYGAYLLTKVDAEIQHKSAHGGKRKPLTIQLEEEGTVCQRVFSEIGLRSPESPEDVLGDALGMFRETSPTQSDAEVMPEAGQVCPDASSVVEGEACVQVDNDDKSQITSSLDGGSGSGVPALALNCAGQSVPDTNMQSSANTALPTPPAAISGAAKRAEMAPARRLARLSANSRKPPAESMPVLTARVGALVGETAVMASAAVETSGPRAGSEAERRPRSIAVKPMSRHTASMRGRAAIVAAVRGRGSVIARRDPPVTRAQDPSCSNSQPAQGPLNTVLDPAPIQIGNDSMTGASPVDLLLRAHNVRDEWELSSRRTTQVQKLMTNDLLHRPASGKLFRKPVAATSSVQSDMNRELLTAAASESAPTSQAAPGVMLASTPAAPTPATPASVSGPSSMSALTSVSASTSVSALPSVSAPSSMSSAPSLLTATVLEPSLNSVLAPATALATSTAISSASADEGSGRESGHVQSVADNNVQRSTKVFCTDSNVVSSGFNTTSGESSASDGAGMGSNSVNVQQLSARTRVLSGDSTLSQNSEANRGTSAQGIKRSATPPGLVPVVEPKRSLLDVVLGRTESSSGPADRDQEANTRESRLATDRPVMHRPWLTAAEGPDNHSWVREMPGASDRHALQRERRSYPMDTRQEGSSRGWREQDGSGQIRGGQIFEDRPGNRNSSLMERTIGPPGRVIDYEHLERGAIEDFHQRRGQGRDMVSQASLDSLRRNGPLDLSLSERRLKAEREAMARNSMESSMWRGQLMQRHLQQQQATWQRLGGREVGLAMRSPAVSLVHPLEQVLRPQGHLPLHFSEGRELQHRGPGATFRNHTPGPFTRGYPPERRPFM